MKLDSYSVYRYSLPLRRPLTLAGHPLDARAGGLVAWRADGSVVGWGEISPLPGLNHESLDQALAQTAEVCRGMLGREITMDGFWAGDLVPDDGLFPSVTFGLESSLLDLLSRKSGLGLPQILVDGPADSVPIAGLVHGEEVVEQAAQLVERGFGCLKIKVGRGSWRDAAKRVSQVRSAVPESVVLRLDANRGWSLPDAVCFAREVGSERIEFIEEPVENPRDLPEFTGESPLPVALDETVAESGLKMLSRLDHVAAVVIKPTKVGGLREVCRISEKCWDEGVTPVISSSFESAVGLVALAGLAACVQGPDVAAGLGTGEWFCKDTMDPGLIIEEGAVDVAAFGRTLQWVVEDALEEVHRG